MIDDGMPIQQGMPFDPYQVPSGTMPIRDQSPDFMQWLFSFREQVVEPLKFIWRGYEQDEKGNWIKSNDCKPIMNEKGIMWSISLIESYINPVFVVSNYDEDSYNARMRILTKFIINSLCLRYREFEMNKTDIPRIVDEIESKVQAILLGARGNGYRLFFSSTREIKDINHNMGSDQNQSGGMFSGLNIFKKNPNMYSR